MLEFMNFSLIHLKDLFEFNTRYLYINAYKIIIYKYRTSVRNLIAFFLLVVTAL